MHSLCMCFVINNILKIVFTKSVLLLLPCDIVVIFHKITFYYINYNKTSQQHSQDVTVKTLCLSFMWKHSLLAGINTEIFQFDLFILFQEFN